MHRELQRGLYKTRAVDYYLLRVSPNILDGMKLGLVVVCMDGCFRSYIRQGRCKSGLKPNLQPGLQQVLLVQLDSEQGLELGLELGLEQCLKPSLEQV